MHLWPSMRIRDSFKLGYLRNLEWNLNRMKSEKHEPSTNQTLLGNKEPVANGRDSSTPNSENRGGALAVFREIMMLLSCCYCCFCCGGNLISPSLLRFLVFRVNLCAGLRFFRVGFDFMRSLISGYSSSF